MFSTRRYLVLAYEDWEPRILERIKLQDITDCLCHWPYGDPFEHSFRFCGLPCYKHYYCYRHYARAYHQPQQTKRTRYEQTLLTASTR